MYFFNETVILRRAFAHDGVFRDRSDPLAFSHCNLYSNHCFSSDRFFCVQATFIFLLIPLKLKNIYKIVQKIYRRDTVIKKMLLLKYNKIYLGAASVVTHRGHHLPPEVAGLTTSQ